MSLVSYLEIISQEEWRKESYKDFVLQTLSMKEYKQNLPKVKALFKKINKGKFSPNIIIDFNSQQAETIKIDSQDIKLINALDKAGYEINAEMYKIGVIKKDGKEKKLIDVLDTLMAKNEEKMYDVYKQKMTQAREEKNERAGAQGKKIWRQIELIRTVKEQIETFKIKFGAMGKGYKLVFSMVPRKIASQSTCVGWTSCMNLEEGEYRDKVGRGIREGGFIVFLARQGDEDNLDKPTARVMVKPFHGREKEDLFWAVDKVYGTAPESFKQTVIDIVNRYNPDPKSDMYDLDDEAFYVDEIPTKLMDELEQMPDPALEAYLTAIKGDFSKIDKLEEKWQKTIFRRQTSRFRDVDSIPVKYQRMIIDIHGYNDMYYIKNVDPELAKEVIKKSPKSIESVKNPSDELIILAVKLDKDAYFYIRYNTITDRAAREILDIVPNAIEHIKEPTKDMAIKAVSYNAVNLRYLPEKLQLDIDILTAAANKSMRDLIRVAILNEFIGKLPEEINLKIIEDSPEMISRMPNPSPALQLKVVQKSTDYISSINVEVHKKVIDWLIKDNPAAALNHFQERIGEEGVKKIIKKDPSLILEFFPFNARDRFDIESFAIELDPSLYHKLVPNAGPKAKETYERLLKEGKVPEEIMKSEEERKLRADLVDEWASLQNTIVSKEYNVNMDRDSGKHSIAYRSELSKLKQRIFIINRKTNFKTIPIADMKKYLKEVQDRYEELTEDKDKPKDRTEQFAMKQFILVHRRIDNHADYISRYGKEHTEQYVYTAKDLKDKADKLERPTIAIVQQMKEQLEQLRDTQISDMDAKKKEINLQKKPKKVKPMPEPTPPAVPEESS